MKTLDLWKHVAILSVDEFMCLLFGYKPGTMKFDYGNPKDWPEGADIIYKLLADDIWTGKLHAFFEDPYLDPRDNQFFSEEYEQPRNPWWQNAKLFKHQLVKWLGEKGIPSEFFGVPTISPNNSDQKGSIESAVSLPTQGAAAKEELIQEVQSKRRYRKGDVSIKEAAIFFDVSTRTIQNWDDGINTPHGYPGRGNLVELKKFAFQYQSQKDTKKAASAMNRAVSGGDIAGNVSDEHSLSSWEEHEDDESKYEDDESEYEVN